MYLSTSDFEGIENGKCISSTHADLFAQKEAACRSLRDLLACFRGMRKRRAVSQVPADGHRFHGSRARVRPVGSDDRLLARPYLGRAPQSGGHGGIGFGEKVSGE